MKMGRIGEFKIDRTNINMHKKAGSYPSPQNQYISNNTGIDTVSISDEARNLYNMDMEDRLSILEMLKELDEQGKDNSSDEFLKCLKIALRIMSGDRVPRKDERFLAEKQPQMYSNAIMLRRQKEYYKDYDSLLEDEDSMKDTELDDLEPAKSESSNTPETPVSSEDIDG